MTVRGTVRTRSDRARRRESIPVSYDEEEHIVLFFCYIIGYKSHQNIARVPLRFG